MTKSSSSATLNATKMSSSTWQRITTIGIDLGDRFSQWCALDAGGKIVAEERVSSTRPALTKLFGDVPRKRIAIETGTHSPWISALLESLGHEVLVGNSRKIQLISNNRQKDDRSDARTLARLARFDPELLYPIRHRNRTAQAQLELIRARDVLVAVRTRIVNHVRGAVKSFGVRLPQCSPSALVKKGAAMIPPELDTALKPMLDMVRTVSAAITEYDRRIERLADDDHPDSRALRQIDGVGALTAMAFMLTISDKDRFTRSRSVGPWLGLTPARHDSSDTKTQKRISKEGDHYVRRLLVGSAQYILGPFGHDCDLRRFGLAIAARGGKNAKRRATVAIARKLAVLMHRLWVTQAVYVPLRKTMSTAAA